MKQADILVAIRAGAYDPPVWAELWCGPIAVSVMADALKIDGVRVTVSARTAQLCADALGCMLPTPMLEDGIWSAADRRLPAFPIPGGPDGSWAQTVAHSKRIDDALRTVSALPSQLVATVGKSWVLTNALVGRRDVAANYGWHDEGAPSHGVTGLPLWQSVGTRHNLDHADYSQTLRLVRRACRLRVADELRGATVLDMLTDPTLCHHLSHEGPLALTRQPGADE